MTIDAQTSGNDETLVGARPSNAPATPAVQAEQIRMTFPTDGRDRLVALDGLSLAVASREIVAIVGPNGSGKSTLLRVIGGLLTPDAGMVEIEGRRVTGPDAAVGFVFQEPRLLPWQSALGNVAYPLELAGESRTAAATRATELLQLVGLRRFATARPHELSGGMRQRVAIARALALGPSVLLLDEPFSALDALTRERFGVELLGLHERTGTTIVLVTHSIQEAVFLADRVVVLSARPGHVVREIPSPLPRRRTLADLASPAFAAAAAEVRVALGPLPGEDDRDVPTPGGWS